MIWRGQDFPAFGGIPHIIIYNMKWENLGKKMALVNKGLERAGFEPAKA